MKKTQFTVMAATLLAVCVQAPTAHAFYGIFNNDKTGETKHGFDLRNLCQDSDHVYYTQTGAVMTLLGAVFGGASGAIAVGNTNYAVKSGFVAGGTFIAGIILLSQRSIDAGAIGALGPIPKSEAQRITDLTENERAEYNRAVSTVFNPTYQDIMKDLAGKSNADQEELDKSAVDSWASVFPVANEIDQLTDEDFEREFGYSKVALKALYKVFRQGRFDLEQKMQTTVDPIAAH